MEALARLGPVPAFALVVGGLGLAGLAGAVIDDRLSYSAMNSIAAMVYLGWPYLIGMTVTKRAEGWHVARTMASLSMVYVLAFHVLAGIFPIEDLRGQAPIQWGVFLIAWLLAMAGTFDLLWFGASALVAVEEGKRIRLDHCIGTLLQFLFLPIGILFLQGRVKSLLAITR